MKMPLRFAFHPTVVALSPELLAEYERVWSEFDVAPNGYGSFIPVSDALLDLEKLGLLRVLFEGGPIKPTKKGLVILSDLFNRVDEPKFSYEIISVSVNKNKELDQMKQKCCPECGKVIQAEGETVLIWKKTFLVCSVECANGVGLSRALVATKQSVIVQKAAIAFFEIFTKSQADFQKDMEALEAEFEQRVKYYE